MDKYSDFKVFPYRNHYILSNKYGDESHHTHIKSSKTCWTLVKLICKCEVPRSDYLRESARRVSRNEKYIQKINIKEEKDSDKQKYIRPNMGKFG